MRTGRHRLRALACTAVVAAVLVGPLPSAAHVSSLGPDVVAAREVWKAAEEVRDEAAGVLADVAEARDVAEDEADAAAVALDAATTALVRREREHAAAERTFADAEAAADASLAALHHAVGVYEADLSAVFDRTDAHAEAAATAFAYGDPQVRALSTLVATLDRSASAGDFLSATERLQWVTEDTRARLDTADEALGVAAEAVDAAAKALVRDRLVQRDAAARRDATAAVLEAKRERRAEAEEAHEETVALAEALDAAFAEADAALGRAQAAVDAARADLRALGWRAGVPGHAGLVWPVDGAPGSGFGPRTHPIHGDVRPHLGVDVAAPAGRPVVAAADGRVVAAGPRGRYGIAVVLDHGDGRSTLYAHLSAIAVRFGQEVHEAERVGAVGSTGQSTAPHLHFEVRERGSPRDPMPYFR